MSDGASPTPRGVRMSLVGKQRGDTRRVPWHVIAAAAAGLSLAAPAPPAAIAPLVPRGQTETTRQAVPPETKRVSVQKKGPRRGTGSGRPRAFNPHRMRRRILTALFGVHDTGRQWTKLRRVLRRVAPRLLVAPLPQLVQLPALRLVHRKAA